jgi:dTDP-4-amino-4,6-dideoxygalactose transaminase
MFSEFLHVGRPNVGDRDRLIERINGALDRNWLSNNGPLVREFEQRVAEISGTKYCVATCNGTNAIQIAAKAAGIRTGDQVIVPSFTWVATAHALEWMGVVPVFCDVDEKTGTIDVAHAARLIGPETRGILGVHVFGYPCAAEPLSDLAGQYEIPLLFDAAHAFGSTYAGKPIGSFGQAEAFSFHATKWINTFEGGAVVTNDARIAEAARTMCQQGLSANRKIVGPGTVARMSEIAAAMGLTSLDAMPDFMAVNQRNYELYEAGLAGIPGVVLRQPAPGERANNQYMVIEVDARTAGVDADELNSVLHSHNVLSRRYFHPGCHQTEPYVANPAVHAPLPLPRTEALTRRVLSLPTGMSIGAAEVNGICEIIRATVSPQ